MEKRQYIALVLREANVFLGGNESAVRAAGRSGDWNADLDTLLERQLQDVLVGVEYLEDIVKFSGLEAPDPELWRDADDWQGVLAGVAAAGLAHDIRMRALDIIDGRIPRMENIQTW